MIDPSAQVDPSAQIGPGTRIWGLAQVRAHARLGSECIVGRAVYVGRGVQLGDRVKLQNLAQVYEPALIEDGVFVGPGTILTNDTYPRAINPDGSQMCADQWEAVAVIVREGASIGARAVCVAPVTIGRWSMVGAGATVIRDVPDYALVVGSPARQIGWVGRAGRRLIREGEGWVCPHTGERYKEVNGRLAMELP